MKAYLIMNINNTYKICFLIIFLCLANNIYAASGDNKKGRFDTTTQKVGSDPMTEERNRLLIKHEEFFNDMGLVGRYIESGKTDEAFTILEKYREVVEGSSLEGVVRGKYVDYYEKVGEYDKAITLVEKFMAPAPPHTDHYKHFDKIRQRIIDKKNNASDQD